MIAKDIYFREGWIMLKRPFEFHELSNPLQKLTLLYAFADRPIIRLKLDEKGMELYQDYLDNYGKPPSVTGGKSIWNKLLNESENEYELRVERDLNNLYKNHQRIEIYEGHMVQCYVEGQLCKFYPEEYSIIGPDTFQMAVEGEEYLMKVENENVFQMEEIKNKIFYMRQRGVPLDKSKKWSSSSLKDSIYFKPRMELLEMFAYPNEILLPDSDYE